MMLIPHTHWWKFIYPLWIFVANYLKSPIWEALHLLLIIIFRIWCKIEVSFVMVKIMQIICFSWKSYCILDIILKRGNLYRVRYIYIQRTLEKNQHFIVQHSPSLASLSKNKLLKYSYITINNKKIILCQS